eukprot:g728.t1
MAANQTLPSREQGLFRNIVKSYETKQYKKGVKTADGILRKFPEHGETLSMKGLILNSQQKKKEAYALVKLGLRHNMRSHVCWHVYGLLYRSDRDYNQAIKCYRNALRIDTENQQILRDLSSLQVQMRDVRGFRESRRQLLQLKSNSRNNWVTFAISQHLCGEPAQAVGILDAYLETEEKGQPATYESSEMLLYRNELLQEAGDADAALAHLDAVGAKVVDKLGWRLARARLLGRAGRFEESAAAFMELVQSNAENYQFHCGLQCARLQTPALLELRGCDTPARVLELSAAQRAALEALYDELEAAGAADKKSALRRSIALRRIRLSFSAVEGEGEGEGRGLRARLDAYLRDALRRGVPSLAADVKEFYLSRARAARRAPLAEPAADARVRLLGALAGGYVEALRGTGRFPGAAADAPLEAPTALLWALCLLAQHHYRLGDFGAALALVCEAEEHTPTALDVLQLKGKVLKRCGDAAAAAAVVDGARAMDLQDRYINNKATKYLLRAGEHKRAESLIGLFTRQEGDQAVAHSLYDMQCSWYELEVARAHAAAGAWGPALRTFASVEKHFSDFAEDQFDFHGYCVRKTTLRAYVQLLRSQDRLRGHELYVRAALGAARVYLQLHARPAAAAAEEAAPDFSQMTAPERKAAKAKLRRAEAKRRKAAEEAAAAEEEAAAKAKAAEEEAGKGKDKDKKKAGGGKKEPHALEEDPRGEALAATEAPLAEAWRLAQQLSAHAAARFETHALAYDVARRRGKALLALRALNRLAGVVRAARRDARRQAGEQLDGDGGGDGPLQGEAGVEAAGEAELLLRAADFARWVSELQAGAAAAAEGAAQTPAAALAVLASERDRLLGGTTPAAFVESFAEAHARSLPHRCAAAEALASLGGGKARIAALLSGLGEEGVVVGVELGACVRAHELMQSEAVLGDAELAARYKARCAALFPHSTHFADGYKASPPPAAK